MLTAPDTATPPLRKHYFPLKRVFWKVEWIIILKILRLFCLVFFSERNFCVGTCVEHIVGEEQQLFYFCSHDMKREWKHRPEFLIQINKPVVGANVVELTTEESSHGETLLVTCKVYVRDIHARMSLWQLFRRTGMTWIYCEGLVRKDTDEWGLIYMYVWRAFVKRILWK